MPSPWLTWSYIPGLHWVAWLHAAIVARYPQYYGFALAYALPVLFTMATRRAPWRFLLGSWLVAIIHTQLQQRAVNRRIAAATSARPNDTLMQALLRAALQHGGCLSVTEGVLETGATFSDVERTLQQMVAAGYVYMRNNPHTGVVEYVFKEVL